MAWYQIGDKPLYKQMMAYSVTELKEMGWWKYDYDMISKQL